MPGVGSSEQHPPAEAHIIFFKLGQTFNFWLADSVKLFAGPYKSEQFMKMAVCAGNAIDTGNALLDKTTYE